MRTRSTLSAALIAVAASVLAAGQAPAATGQPLTVCADPANLPYSNRKEEGFENKIAKLLAADMKRDLRFAWFPEHNLFLRKTLQSGLCDLVVAVPVGMPMLAETKPYFVSTYFAVTRAKDKLHFGSFDDAWLRDAKIGLQLVGHEGVTTPVAVALSRRGVVQHITAFEMWGAPDQAEPQGKIIDAVADGRIDVALVWGPFAGFFAKKHGDALKVEPIMADPKQPDLQFVFPMAMGVRKDDTALKTQLQAAIDRNQAPIAAILKDYGIPTLAGSPAASPGAETASTGHD